MTKRVFIKTWGCQMNVYDSARMADVLAPHGYASAEDAAQADLVIFNTCHIREKATEKLFSELGRLRPLKEARPGLKIAVAGCVAQAEGAEIIARAPQVNVVVGPQSFHRLPELVAADRPAGAAKPVDTEFPVESKFDRLPEEAARRGASAFLAVQEGCDKFCSFCVVPYTRGAEYSRPAAAILAEARRLVAGGSVEITLLGQNVNAWHGAAPDGGSWDLGRLVRALAEIEGLARLRYTTSHPLDMTEGLISAHATVPQLMPFLHLPVQSGSDRVLAAMNRRHSVDDYRRIVDRLRAARPDLALSSDFIVGHPGETDDDFAATLALIGEIGFAQAYSFKYSPRAGTPAANAPAQISEAVKAERLDRLQALIGAQQQVFNAAAVGRTVPVLFDRPGRQPGQLLGRTPHMQSVHAPAPAGLLGRIAGVVVEAVRKNGLAGRLAHPSPEEHEEAARVPA